MGGKVAVTVRGHDGDVDHQKGDGEGAGSCAVGGQWMGKIPLAETETKPAGNWVWKRSKEATVAGCG